MKREEKLKKSKSYISELRSSNHINDGRLICIVSESGEETYVTPKQVPNLLIVSKAKNYLIKIYKPFKFRKRITMSVGEGCFVSLGTNFVCRHDVFFNIIGRNTSVVFGKDCNVANLTLVGGDDSNNSLLVGDDFISAVDLRIKLNDGHIIYDNQSRLCLNRTQFGVVIGDHVWCGEDVLIMKDAYIPNNCVIGARSLITKKDFEPYSIIAGHPAQTLKTGINWNIKNYSNMNESDDILRVIE
jgi:acetyltransferase-like isoleucine patch superfamily enzyme